MQALSTLIKLLEIDSVNDNNTNNVLLQEWQVNNNGDLLQEWLVNDNKFNNNKDKICLLLRRPGWWVTY